MSKIYNKPHFKEENEYNYNSEELEFIQKKEFDSKAVSEVQEKKDKKFVEDMESDYAADIVAGTEIAKKKREQKRFDDVANMLDLSSTSDYRANMAEWGMWNMMQIGMDKDFKFICIPTTKQRTRVFDTYLDTEEGILFFIEAPNKKTFASGMRCSYDPMVDTVAVQNFMIRIENTYEHIRKSMGRA